MIFSSVAFLFVFLPLALAIHSGAPLALRNTVLLAISIVFYWYGAGLQVFLLFASIVVDYVCGTVQSRSKSDQEKKICVVVSILCNLGLLFYFKYYDFFADSLNHLLVYWGLPPFSPLNVVLPIGISFYTFQTISYQVDLYRGHVKHEKNLINFSLFVALFPQLVAGPIVRYRDIRKQLPQRSLSLELFLSGIVRFITGLAKKVLIADQLGGFVQYGYSRPPEALPFELAWLAAFAFVLQVYFDFSAYSDMAIGIGKMLGFHFPENFNYPFTAKTLGEFWRRWHITLMRWFRDYLYAALRKLPGGRNAQDRNVLLIFAASGLWHGASWPFVFWGIYHGLFLIAERRFLGRFIQLFPSPIQFVYPLTVFTVSAAFFRAESLTQSVWFLRAMVGFNRHATLDGLFYFHFDTEFIATLIAAALLSTFAAPTFLRTLDKVVTSVQGHPVRVVFECGLPIAKYGSVAALLLLSLATAVGQQKSPFIYFQF